MTTKIEVQSTNATGSDIHVVEGTPSQLAGRVNLAIGRKEKFITFDVPGEKSLSVIAERIEAIWQE